MDTYGGIAHHGGGAFSGKDPSKVDRSAAYAARYVAKHIVAAGLADRCEIQVAYAIGIARPVSLMVNTFGTGVIPETRLEAVVQDIFDLRPKAIIRELNLLRPIFKQTAAYGHFGREEADFTWKKRTRLNSCGTLPVKLCHRSASPASRLFITQLTKSLGFLSV